jgi:hypothetical protein
VGTGWQANFPEEPLAPSRDWEKQKGWVGVGATGQSPKAGQVVDPGSDLLEQKTVFKTELPHLARGGANQTELQLKDNTAAAWWKQQLWPPCMSWQNYLTSQLQLILWTDGTKYYSQVSHLVRPHQSFCLYANTRIGHLRNNSRTFTKRLNFLWFLNLVFKIVFLFF